MSGFGVKATHRKSLLLGMIKGFGMLLLLLLHRKRKRVEEE
jgi:hypothetical protein